MLTKIWGLWRNIFLASRHWRCRPRLLKVPNTRSMSNKLMDLTKCKMFEVGLIRSRIITYFAADKYNISNKRKGFIMYANTEAQHWPNYKFSLQHDMCLRVNVWVNSRFEGQQFTVPALGFPTTDWVFPVRIILLLLVKPRSCKRSATLDVYNTQKWQNLYTIHTLVCAGKIC